jgi:hypothetical protein
MPQKVKKTAYFETLLTLCVMAGGAVFTYSLMAQSPELQQKFAAIKEAQAKNKEALAQYTWMEQDTISLKGEVKKQEHFQVRLGPDGKPQKTSLDPPAPADAAPQGGRLKRHIVEKKKEEYKDYADQIKALIQQYLPLDKEALQAAYQKGNVTLVFSKAQKGLVSLTINSYLNDPKDAVNVNAQFSQIPGGPNHISSQTIDGVSKQLTIAVQNSNYQKA